MQGPVPPAPAIHVKGLVKRFGATLAVNGLELSVARGECMGLLGPNGAGKSTTLEILEGLQSPTEGEVHLLGLCWKKHAKQLRARIGVAQQQTWLYDRLSVEETLALFRSFHAQGLDVEEALGRVRLEDKRKDYVMNLSGGQRQRLSLALALVGNPDILFLDEPTTGLDPRSRRALWELLEELRAGGRTVMLSTHYLEEARRLCDRVVILDRGRIVAQGRPSELIASLEGGLEEGLEAGRPPALAREVTLDDVYLAFTGHGPREGTRP
ncbi:ABC transporter ATP-binding protein [Cystobacter ferrugineus]|uniref:ABC transporter domain-containing protein n=1 Tax=Cystobacter ferrugineus TaxID=83449 RepID=A0A1L9B341_9BACT|nr:ABC transporter ATP-binding protein [Cystobacter ferrugineus]OJH36682.1 hypothetical protein BON30_33610 [Cystobacter ferrugineus]